MSKDGGPAFPLTDDALDENSEPYHWMRGMSLRDWFAGMALQGYIATSVDILHDDGTQYATPITSVQLAELAYQQADAMLQQRDK